jgi:hypothetical protein
MSHEIEVADPLLRTIGEFRKELLLWIDTEMVRLHERVQADESVVETVTPLAALPEPQTAAEPQSHTSNPRKRLDDLARLLDHRLKQAQGAAASSAGTGQAPNNGVADDTP